MNEHCCFLEDSYYFLEEDTKSPNYIVQDNEKLYPVYIFLLQGNCMLSKAIQKVTSSQFSHAAIGFDLAFKNLYSFNFETLRKGGFSRESLANYIKELGSEDIYFKVNVFFVREKRYRYLRSRISYYKSHEKDTKYDFINLIRNVFKIKVEENQLKLVCSEFVAAVCEFAGIRVVKGNSINLVTPNDLANCDKTNRRVYNLYEGTYKDFSVNSMKGKLYGIKNRAKVIRESSNNIDD